MYRSHLAEDRDWKRAFVNTVMNLLLSLKGWADILDQLNHYQFLNSRLFIPSTGQMQHRSCRWEPARSFETEGSEFDGREGQWRQYTLLTIQSSTQWVPGVHFLGKRHPALFFPIPMYSIWSVSHVSTYAAILTDYKSSERHVQSSKLNLTFRHRASSI